MALLPGPHNVCVSHWRETNADIKDQQSPAKHRTLRCSCSPAVTVPPPATPLILARAESQLSVHQRLDLEARRVDGGAVGSRCTLADSRSIIAGAECCRTRRSRHQIDWCRPEYCFEPLLLVAERPERFSNNGGAPLGCKATTHPAGSLDLAC